MIILFVHDDCKPLLDISQYISKISSLIMKKLPLKQYQLIIALGGGKKNLLPAESQLAFIFQVCWMNKLSKTDNNDLDK